MSKQIRVDVYDAQGQKVGLGPIFSATSIDVTRALDGAGRVGFSAPVSTERVRDLVDNEREVRFNILEHDRVPRQVGAGIIRDINVANTAKNLTLSASGPDILDDLIRFNTLLSRQYQATPLPSVFSQIAALAGWTTTIEPGLESELLSVRFDGETVLHALQMTAEQLGLHIRPSLSVSKQLEIGYFGNTTEIVLINPKQYHQNIYQNKKIMVVDKINVKRSTKNLVNWLLPLGGGEGKAALTLKHSTRTAPYPIKTMAGPDGDLIYYIENTDSQARYRLRQKVGTFKNINPLNNSESSLTLAANALYDAAAAYLEKYSVRLDTYDVSVKKVNATIQPGDIIQLVYAGTTPSGDYIDTNEYFWVMKVSEQVSRSGVSATLQLTSIDRYEQDTAKIIVGAIEAIQMRNLRVQPYPAFGSYVYRRELDEGHSARIPIEITQDVLYLDQCRVSLFTRPFRATSKGTNAAAATVGTTAMSAAVGGTSASGGDAAISSASGGGATSSAGGDHRHRMFEFVSYTGSGGVTGFTDLIASVGNTFSPLPVIIQMVQAGGSGNSDIWTESASGNHTHTIPNHTHTVNLPSHTHEFNLPEHNHQITIPAHNHTLEYGIVDDDEYPINIRLEIDGVDVTEALGGPWATSGGELNLDGQNALDITNYLVNSSQGLRTRHELLFTSESGQGEIEVTARLRTTVQSIIS